MTNTEIQAIAINSDSMIVTITVSTQYIEQQLGRPVTDGEIEKIQASLQRCAESTEREVRRYTVSTASLNNTINPDTYEYSMDSGPLETYKFRDNMPD